MVYPSIWPHLSIPWPQDAPRLSLWLKWNKMIWGPVTSFNIFVQASWPFETQCIDRLYRFWEMIEDNCRCSMFSIMHRFLPTESITESPFMVGVRNDFSDQTPCFCCVAAKSKCFVLCPCFAPQSSSWLTLSPYHQFSNKLIWNPKVRKDEWLNPILNHGF